MPELMIYGAIGDPDAQLDAQTVCTAIRNARGNLTVRINSPGGLIMEGLPIYEALKAYSSGTVTVMIDGLAASMASVIAMAAGSILMAENAFVMIHQPWDCSIGTADDLRADASVLDKMEERLVAIYAARTGLDSDQISLMMADETWLDATEAVALGFADKINSPLPLAAMARLPDLTACGFRRSPTSSKGSIMTETTPAAPLGAGNNPSAAVMVERQRVTQIHALCDKHRMPDGMAANLVNRGVALADARETVLEALANRDMAASAYAGGGHGGGSFDDPDFLGKAMGDALYSKLSGKAVDGAAAEFRGMSLIDMAAEMVERSGRGNPRRMKPDQILNAAAWLGGGPRNVGSASGFGGGMWGGNAAITTTTGDFPNLLQGVGERYLLDQYRSALSPLKQLGRPRLARDFRPINILQLSEFGTLPVVAEGAEITSGTFSERKEVYSLQTFAKNFSLSRQAIINDDLNAFGDTLTIMGRAAAETEAQVLAGLINSNPVMADGNGLFSVQHGNMNATGAAPDVGGLDAVRQSMRSQKDMDGVTFINAVPRYIVSGLGMETYIEKLVSIPLTATQVSNANPFAGKIAPLCDPRLSGNFWYVFADPEFVPTFEYANMNNMEGPQMEMQNGWDVLGVSFRVFEDFGAAAVDWRGAYRQAGL